MTMGYVIYLFKDKQGPTFLFGKEHSHTVVIKWDQKNVLFINYYLFPFRIIYLNLDIGFFIHLLY